MVDKFKAALLPDPAFAGAVDQLIGAAWVVVSGPRGTFMPVGHMRLANIHEVCWIAVGFYREG